MRGIPLLLAVLIALSPAAGLAADPVVSNVTAVQRTDGSGLVDVHYDLADADGDPCTVAINASEDGGATWYLPCHSLSGDVGDGVTPGAGKHAVWDFGYDNTGWSGDDFRVQVIASDLGNHFGTHSPRIYAAHHWGPFDWTDTALIEEMSRADLLTITTRGLWDNGPGEAEHIIDQIKSFNPDCRVIGYIPSEVVILEWEQDLLGSYTRTLFDELKPYWSYTTTGDTLTNWPGVVVLNILDETCRDIIVSNVADYQAQSDTKFDGVFWDYFPDYIWIPDFVECEGDPDLDGDGVPHWSDNDEIFAYRAAQEDLVGRMRSALGDGFIQVFNGVRAQRDSVFAALGDGINYEIYPTLKFDEPRTASSLDVDVPHSLWHSSTWPRSAAGGPYILLENIWRYNFVDDQGEATKLDSGDIFRVIGLLVDNVYPVWDSIGIHNWDWPDVLVNLGEPLGPTVIDGDVFTRDYTYGDVWMEMKGGDWPNPFRYRITVNGQLVEMIDTPYHHP